MKSKRRKKRLSKNVSKQILILPILLALLLAPVLFSFLPNNSFKTNLEESFRPRAQPLYQHIKANPHKYSLSADLEKTEIYAGSSLKATINIKGASTNPFNATVNYFVRDSQDNIVYKETQDAYIGRDSINKVVELPNYLSTSKYTFVIDLIYDDGFDSYSSFFTITKNQSQIFGQ